MEENQRMEFYKSRRSCGGKFPAGKKKFEFSSKWQQRTFSWKWTASDSIDRSFHWTADWETLRELKNQLIKLNGVIGAKIENSSWRLADQMGQHDAPLWHGGRDLSHKVKRATAFKSAPSVHLGCPHGALVNASGRWTASAGINNSKSALPIRAKMAAKWRSALARHFDGKQLVSWRRLMAPLPSLHVRFDILSKFLPSRVCVQRSEIRFLEIKKWRQIECHVTWKRAVHVPSSMPFLSNFRISRQFSRGKKKKEFASEAPGHVTRKVGGGSWLIRLTARREKRSEMKSKWVQRSRKIRRWFN